MSKYLIEIHHSTEHEGCVRALNAIMQFGSHLATHADFGCEDGVHIGWLIVDVESREDAHQMVPPQYRADARIIQLRRWNRQEIESMLAELEA
jgi:hypothetical protein